MAQKANLIQDPNGQEHEALYENRADGTTDTVTVYAKVRPQYAIDNGFEVYQEIQGPVGVTGSECMIYGVTHVIVNASTWTVLERAPCDCGCN